MYTSDYGPIDDVTERIKNDNDFHDNRSSSSSRERVGIDENQYTPLGAQSNVCFIPASLCTNCIILFIFPRLEHRERTVIL